MKFVKKLTALFLAIVMTMAMGITAFADESNDQVIDDYSITIEVDEAVEGTKYAAYQVFTGTLLPGTDGAKSKTLGDIKWNDAVVDGNAIVTALKNSDITKNDFPNATYTAAEVAEVLKGYDDNGTKLEEFARIAAENIKSNAPKTESGAFVKDSGEDVESGSYTISGLRAGYYVVVDESANIAQGKTRSKYILKVVEDVTVEPKVEDIEIDKKITNTGANAPLTDSDSKVNTAAIGDVINYEITGTVPAHQSYTYYYYNVSDKLSKGLTLNENSFVVQIEDTDGNVVKTLTKLDAAGSDTISKTAEGYVLDTKVDETSKETTFTLAIANIKNLTPGYGISIKYNATVNADAVVGDVDANTNTAKLIYSNDPKHSQGGKYIPDNEEDVNYPKGTTPDVVTKTYVTEIKLTKVDKDNKTLTGAIFTLEGKNLNTIKFTSGIAFREEENTDETSVQRYYKLTDGTYTKEAPRTTDVTEEVDGKTITHKANTDQYINGTGKTTASKMFVQETVLKAEGVGTDDVKITAEVGADGTLTFRGLNAGDYKLTEEKAPAGYNKLTESIEFTITAEGKKSAEGVKYVDGIDWNITADKGFTDSTDSVDSKAGTFAISIQNNLGTELPSTGGMGTTLIYIAGIAMIIAAGVVIIARKRMA